MPLPAHADWLAHRATAVPDRLALRSGGIDLTYAELSHEGRVVAERLRADGVIEGAIVPVDLPPGPEFVATLHALWGLGAAAEPQRRGAPPPQKGETASVVPHEASIGTFPPGAGVMTRLYTSGTTGTPRAVDLTRENFFHSAIGTAFALGLGPYDRRLCCLPLHHVAGLSILTR